MIGWNQSCDRYYISNKGILVIPLFSYGKLDEVFCNMCNCLYLLVVAGFGSFRDL